VKAKWRVSGSLIMVGSNFFCDTNK
jgi:hypothetical protein